MNAYGMVLGQDALRVANEKMQQLHREADIERMASASRDHRGLIGRIAAAVASVKAALAVVDGDLKPQLPTITDYPYRS